MYKLTLLIASLGLGFGSCDFSSSLDLPDIQLDGDGWDILLPTANFNGEWSGEGTTRSSVVLNVRLNLKQANDSTRVSGDYEFGWDSHVREGSLSGSAGWKGIVLSLWNNDVQCPDSININAQKIHTDTMAVVHFWGRDCTGLHSLEENWLEGDWLNPDGWLILARETTGEVEAWITPAGRVR